MHQPGRAELRHTGSTDSPGAPAQPGRAPDDMAMAPGQVLAGRVLASKVPVVTVYFWIIKVLTTGMGEAASDSLVRAGGAVAVAAAAVALAASFLAQFAVSRYIPAVYWLAVVMVSVFGTMAADIPHALGVPVWATSAVYLLAVLVIFWVWRRNEGTLSFSAITTRRREAFYWAAVLATFALGTAVGDLTAFSWGWGALASGVIFAVLFALPGAARRWLGFNAVAAFWTAYILTRPLGASFADWMGGSAHRGGLGLGKPMTTLAWSIAIVGFVVFLAVTHRDVRGVRAAQHPGAARGETTRR
jgi:uncharacterized membrane-anchored protein